ncbi:colicin V production protein [Brucella anthropi]|nr:colicin V production protein [Brucella anthropi]
MPITMLDGILLGITLVSAVLAMVRGFSREVLSLVSWAAAAAAAYLFYQPVLPFVQPYINNENHREDCRRWRRLPRRADRRFADHHEDRRFHHRQPYRRA